MKWSGAATGGSDTIVVGERDRTSVYRARSIQSRLSGVLAAGLMLSVGLGMLAWYYGNAVVRVARVRDTARNSVTARAQAEMPLPALGHIDPPAAVAALDPPAYPAARPSDSRPQALLDGARGDRPGQAAAILEADRERSVAPVGVLAETASYAATGGVPAARTAAQIARERRLTGHLFGRAADDPGAVVGRSAFGATADSLRAPPAVPPDASAGTLPWVEASPAGDSTSPAAAAVATIVAARVMPTRRFLLPKGAFIDCTLETAVDSTLPGLTTCITATDTFGADGQVVLLERGTKLIGETRGQVQQGAARVYVMWTEARTPAGVAVPLDSPGTDELGRAGVPGDVNRHFWERFGAAILISTIDGGVQAAVQSGGRGGGTVVYSPTASHDVMTEVLRSTVNIPPTVVKQQGARVQALVARDVDFRPVYELRLASARL